MQRIEWRYEIKEEATPARLQTAIDEGELSDVCASMGISALDLQESIEELTKEGHAVTVGTIDRGHAERACFVYCAAIGRIGIAWGSFADWADVDDLESGIEMWVNDPEEFEARN
jgi:hypothetical protein